MRSAFNNLRAIIALSVVAVHTTLGYVDHVVPATSWADFARWRVIPILDGRASFLPFDLFCGWQDLYLMSLSFFLSGLFVWQGLKKTPAVYVRERLMRLGLPFALGVLLLMPLAYYPVFLRLGGGGYFRAWLDLPFWPNGQLWFLWVLLAFDLLAAGCYWLSPASFSVAREWCSRLSTFKLAALLSGLAVIAYVPLVGVAGPWGWSSGFFNWQLGRPALYAVYFAVGVGVGPSGRFFSGLGGHWRSALIATVVFLSCWLALAGLLVGGAGLALNLVGGVVYALGGVAGCLFMMAVCLRFLNRPVAALSVISENSYGIYVLHYPIVIWLQYALLNVAAPGQVKAAVVFGGALGGSLFLARRVS